MRKNNSTFHFTLGTFTKLTICMTLLIILLIGTRPTLAKHVTPFPAEAQQIKPDEIPNGLTSSEWKSIQNAVTVADYHFSWHQATAETAMPYYWASNRNQGWNVRFAENGTQVTPRNGNWSWGLTLTGYGYEHNLLDIQEMISLTADKETLVYQWDNNLTEWWVNSSAGLEQGFTLQRRPFISLHSASYSPLVLEMVVSGNLTPIINDGDIFFQNTDDVTILRYDQLHVTDADGKHVPAHLQLANSPSTIQIVVDEADAVYPLTIDPWLQTAKLTASDGEINTYGEEETNDYFGGSVAISGDTVVVGACYDDDNGDASGSAYIYIRPSTGWANATEVAKLTASDGVAYDFFGGSVAISDNTIVIGADGDDDNGGHSGSTYVYVRPDTGWVTTSETAKLTASDGASGDMFGVSVAISGNTIAVGTWGEDNSNGTDAGSAYIYVRPSAGWVTTNTYSAKLTASDGQPEDYFGKDIAISGDMVVVGYGGWMGNGSAYIYMRPAGTGWVTTSTYNAKLTASDGAAGDDFGYSVAISGDTVVVGAYYDDDNGDASGSAYVYVRPISGWADTFETAKLTASDGAAHDSFGSSVAISDDTIAVGAGGNDDNGDISGSAYIYVKPDTGWANATETAKFLASDGIEYDQFGESVALDGDTLIVGSPGGASAVHYPSLGAAYIFQNGFCSKTSGNWGTPSIWVGGAVPSSNDDACISAGDTITLIGDAAANRVLVNPNATLDLSTFSLTSEDTVTNNGTMQQNLTVNNSSVEFLHIRNSANNSIKYRGLNIDATTNSENLGDVTVSVKEVNSAAGVYCTSTGDASPDYAARCYTISPITDPTNAVTVRLWGLTEALNGISESNLAVWHNTSNSTWVQLANRATGNDGAYSYAEGTTSDFSPFLLGETGNGPTAVTFQSISVASQNIWWIVILLGSILLVLVSGVILHHKHAVYQI